MNPQEDKFPIEKLIAFGQELDRLNKNKQEQILEQAAENYVSLNKRFADTSKAFVAGANWQAEKMYSGEDMIDFAEWIADSKLHGYTKQLYEAIIRHKVKTTQELLRIWFEKHKKQ